MLFYKNSIMIAVIQYRLTCTKIKYMSGMIEAWGRGFDKIKEACDKYLELLRDDGHHDQNGYDVVMI